MTEDQLIDAIFIREGDTYGDQTTHPPIDQPTGRGGIVLQTLTDYLGHPALVEDLKALTHAQARQIVKWELHQIVVIAQLDAITFEPLRLQMIDFCYNSGPALAIRWLQRCLRVPRTGVIDPLTRVALLDQDLWLVNQALVGARLQMIDLWTDASAQRKAWEEGLESRGLQFSLLEIP
jgi:lysozyme family protein